MPWYVLFCPSTAGHILTRIINQDPLTPQVSELLNLQSHMHLASLAVPPGQPRKFPTGLGFGTVVCANYWFETLGVLAMVFMTMFDIGSMSTVPTPSV